ncbi:DUF2203 domain-containing protein [Alkalihalobacillus oceani]|uniref:DUF2203 domain-containing protein n=1 Tax=Halalkalibacter oceani TaxID=1653776 RepID=A0A9X2INZ3_9BACI|nr:DUF2203 domain-containing protein [Halalkalibacter oceani]MCM3713902.1 DUF2203 domain-containing protein [Halalkalibacter oceani]
MAKIYFTVEEANEWLPTLEQELHELQKLQKQAHEMSTTLQRLKSARYKKLQTETESTFLLESKLEFIDMQFRLHLQNIQASGAQLKDVDRGLVDFPAFIGEKEVLLCWKQGEKEISHYHGLDEGYAGRKPLES